MKFNASPNIRKIMTWWKSRTHTMTNAKLTETQRAGIVDSADCALGWLADLERAIELQLPDAAALCMAEIMKIEARLHDYTNLHTIINRSSEEIRQIAPFAEAGRKAIAGRTRGRDIAHGSKEKREANYHKWQTEIDKTMLKNAALSYEGACIAVSRKFGPSVKTVKRHTKNPATRTRPISRTV
jgi:hypothetical protein